MANLSEKESVTNKYYMPHPYQVFLKVLFKIALWSKILTLSDSKPEDSFLQYNIVQSTCHAELSFRTKN